MPRKNLHVLASELLEALCAAPDRRVGGPGNREATALFARCLAARGFRVESERLACIDWRCDSAALTVGEHHFAVLAGPYSHSCRCRAPLAVVSTAEELKSRDLEGRIVLLCGPIAREQLMPKNFPFYNPESHRRIVGLLETSGIHAVIAATGSNPELAGGQSPYPLIEDGDFELPSAYMTEAEGQRLATLAGSEAELTIEAERIPTSCYNVTGLRGSKAAGRLVLFAHIDSKQGSPGAVDNAGGVVVLLLLADLLAEAKYTGGPRVELAALNGEDYYAAPGQVRFVERGHFQEILLGINLDGPGYRRGKTAYSLYGCSPALEQTVRSAFAGHEELAPGEPWYQSDHGIFIQNQVPALAVTSESFMEISRSITHTASDKPEIIDCGKLAAAAAALYELIRLISEHDAAKAAP
jgi:aminopeptidase YwaD